MELPDDIVSLIREFSRPVTHPGWRYLRRMENIAFHVAVACEVREDCPSVIYNLVANPQTHIIYDLHFFAGVPYVPVVRDTRRGAKYRVTPRY